MDDRIALLGANGNGKSTLAKLLAGRLAPLAGENAPRPKLRVGYFAQHQTDELDLDGTPLDHMAGALPPRHAASRCARSSPASASTRTAPRRRSASLSGGEKARLLLALATREAPQLLILDEPTNHLDIDAREALVKALADFQGAVLLITHDPHLVELVADRLWLVADGTVRPFDGDLDDYRALLAERARPAAKRTPAAAATNAANAPMHAPPWRRCASRHAMPRRGWRGSPRNAAAIEKTLADPALYVPTRKTEIDRRQRPPGRDQEAGRRRRSGMAGRGGGAGSRVCDHHRKGSKPNDLHGRNGAARHRAARRMGGVVRRAPASAAVDPRHSRQPALRVHPRRPPLRSSRCTRSMARRSSPPTPTAIRPARRTPANGRRRWATGTATCSAASTTRPTCRWTRASSWSSATAKAPLPRDADLRWLEAVGLDQSVRRRGLAVMAAAQADLLAGTPGIRVLKPLAARLVT